MVTRLLRLYQFRLEGGYIKEPMGIRISPSVRNHITLQALAEGISKTENMRRIFKAHIQNIPSKKQLQLDIIDNIQKLWDFNDVLTFTDFIRIIKKDLKENNITENQIKYITEKIIK